MINIFGERDLLPLKKIGISYVTAEITSFAFSVTRVTKSYKKLSGIIFFVTSFSQTGRIERKAAELPNRRN